ncbi:MAG: NADH-quinone oxidoreductase subunit L [Candidatus Poribacteria bacterium]|nr:NADH-quinone oxidoreductase subunit L [Candidatus Poribacteria bacterium]
MTDMTPVILLFAPLLIGTLVNGIIGGRLPRNVSGLIGVAAILLSFVGALLGFNAVRTGNGGDITLYTWMAAGTFSADIAFKFDALSSVMILVVTGVSSLIHIYSVGYMDHEDERGFSRFFTYLNLFVFSMLLLVLGNNYLLMFVGWEGVGLCSYLLIGFWYHRTQKEGDTTFPSQAAKKAFVVNRIGDFGFLLGMFFLVLQFGSLSFDTIFHTAAESHGVGMPFLYATTLLLFVGAIGKSAQIPLYVWLPDAMQGPTPVSALIHAATMVTAGVYMVARSSLLFDMAGTGDIVAWVGAITAIFAATMALSATDFKGVLAYSTVSQLGYMFIAVGLGAYSAGVAHLMTHAFFKGLLFLCAGSVLHAVHDVGDIRRLGGLAGKMPVTFGTFAIAAAAIAGFPGLSGFFSKDAILLAAWNNNMPIFVIGAITAFMTAFYMFRLLAIVFAGEGRDPATTVHAHESPLVMRAPLMILAVPAAIAGIGWLGLTENGMFYQFLNPVFEHGHGEHHEAHSWIPMGVSILLALAGMALGFVMYRKRTREELNRTGAIITLLRRKWYVDELYDLVFVQPIHWISRTVLWRLVDKWVIDGAVNVTGAAAYVGGAKLRWLQTGVVQTYAVVIVAGTVLLLLLKVML